MALMLVILMFFFFYTSSFVRLQKKTACFKQLLKVELEFCLKLKLCTYLLFRSSTLCSRLGKHYVCPTLMISEEEDDNIFMENIIKHFCYSA